MKFSLKNGLFLGILIGVASAFLYAPKTGKEIREELREKIDSVPYHFFNLLDSLVDLASSVLDFAKASFHEQQDKVSKAVASGISVARDVAKEKTDEFKRFATTRSSK